MLIDKMSAVPPQRPRPNVVLQAGAVAAALLPWLAIHELPSTPALRIACTLGALCCALDFRRGCRAQVWRLALFCGLAWLALQAQRQAYPTVAAGLCLAAYLGLLGPSAAPAASGRHRRLQVWSLVDATPNDSLAPFALRTDKSHVFSADGRAAVAYRVKWGTAVVSGDPVGDPDRYGAALTQFFALARAQGWRIAALGISERSAPLWRAQGLSTLSIGQEVVLDVHRFELSGRRFRNLRQSVAHTRTCGVKTWIVPEASIDATLREEMRQLMRSTPKGVEPRGFVMILDKPLRGEHPGTWMAYARDAQGRLVGCQRYATADRGRDVTLDIPWRRLDAPNGVDERLIMDVLLWARTRGGERLSLSFAPFPALFAEKTHRGLRWLAYWGAHALDRFIQLESLYRFLRKFHSFGEHRYIALRPMELVTAAAAVLWLEFGGA